MKRREGKTPRRLDAPPEPPLDWDEDDEGFDPVDTVELVVTEENGSSSRVICIAIDGDTTGTTRDASSATRPGAR